MTRHVCCHARWAAWSRCGGSKMVRQYGHWLRPAAALLTCTVFHSSASWECDVGGPLFDRAVCRHRRCAECKFLQVTVRCGSSGTWVRLRNKSVRFARLCSLSLSLLLSLSKLEDTGRSCIVWLLGWSAESRHTHGCRWLRRCSLSQPCVCRDSATIQRSNHGPRAGQPSRSHRTHRKTWPQATERRN